MLILKNSLCIYKDIEKHGKPDRQKSLLLRQLDHTIIPLKYDSKIIKLYFIF